MKSIVLALTALLAASSAFAQGTINFATKVTPTVDARVTYLGAPVGADFVGQLTVNGGAVGAPVAFRATPDAAKGYIVGGGNVNGGLAGGTAVSVSLRAWQGGVGSTYEAAAIKGESASLAGLVLGNAGTPPSPAANLVGLQGFNIVPEPSIAALGLLGAGDRKSVV